MTNEVSPISVSGVCDMFEKLPRLIFLTINPNKGLDYKLRINKIGKWSDFIRKFSSNFLIVRELTGGIHFHALISMNKNKDIKYIKNVHFNCQDVSGKANIPDRELEYIDLCESLETREEVAAVLAVRKEERRKVSKDRLLSSLTKKQLNIHRIIRYVLKDSPREVLVDYLAFKGDKLSGLYDQAVILGEDESAIPNTVKYTPCIPPG